MRFKIGRFNAYKPDIDAVDILKAILKYVDKDKSYNADPSVLQKFFFRMKSEYPKLFEDIYFNDDTWLAYSREIDWAYARTQEDQTTKRPNPDFYFFEIASDNKRLDDEIGEKFALSQQKDLEKIAEIFKKEIGINYTTLQSDKP